jgi:aryl carrier-like protein
MIRTTILVILPSIPKEEVDFYKRFYRFNLDTIPEPIISDDNTFSSVLYDLPKDVDEDTLIFILDKINKMAYVGIYRDIYSRESSIQLPALTTWNQLIECAKQTPQSCISFS